MLGTGSEDEVPELGMQKPLLDDQTPEESGAVLW